jgi:formylglycine-generating enzyme required for sulfatase activity
MKKQQKPILVLAMITAFIAVDLFLPVLISAGEVKYIDRFVANKNGIVWDKKTGLEWVAGPDRNTTWHEAKEWVESLNVSGGGWRMPTRAELKSLYKEGTGSRNMTPLMKTTGWWVWSGETKDSDSAWAFYFRYGNEPWGLRDSSGTIHRGFAVRSRR